MLNKIIIGITIILFGIDLIFLSSIFFKKRKENSVPAITNNSAPTIATSQSSIPTPYICPNVNEKTPTNLEEENAEKNLSSYSYIEKVDSVTPGQPKEDKKITVEILEKTLLSEESFNNKYNQIANPLEKNGWLIKYPRQWKLYKIKRRVSENMDNGYSSVKDYYDLKFEDRDSYFYLREFITLGGQPIILTDSQWLELNKNCGDAFSTENNYQFYLCSGGVIDCAGNMEGYEGIFYPINSYYKSLITINTISEKPDVLIYGKYIPSLDFDRSKFIGGLRAYTLASNFYSNDSQFIFELQRIYTELFGNR